jgi:protocatechuate 3,4-dioxygenase beta subunit
MRKTLFIVAALVMSSRDVVRAQDAPIRGSITGIVIDELGRPIRDVDVYAFPGTARARTDSSGRFIITKLGADFYHVRARRGFVATP